MFCLVTVSSFGQFKLGIQAGYQSAQSIDKGNDQQYYSLSSISTFEAGIVAEQPLSKHLFFETGLTYAEKGNSKSPTIYATSGSTTGVGSTTTTKIDYLQIPLNLAYKTDLNKNVKLIIESGFYIARGISGSEKGTDKSNLGVITTVDKKIQFTSNNDNSSNNTLIKPFDIGYNFNAGIEWNKFQFMANFSRGFGNIYPVGTTSFSNQTIGITVAYLMPWK